MQDLYSTAQLTSEFEVAEMNNLRAEPEINRLNIEQELSQEVHMFNQARELIEEMRRNFTILKVKDVSEESKC